jgi:hypothetical protein
MYAVIRQYSGQGATQLMDELKQKQSDVERLIKGIAGFESYTLMRSSDGGFSISIYRDKAGADESSRQAADFVNKNMSEAARVAAQKSEGEVILHIDAH